MDKIKTTTGDRVIRDARFAIVASRFNEFIVESLLKALVHLPATTRRGDADIEIVRVPGAFRDAGRRRQDRSVAARRRHHCARRVIRGGTPHFDYVAGECVSGIAAAARNTACPVGFGILTVDTIEQAIERAGTKAGNKGEEATLAVIETVNLLRRLD